MKRNPIVFGATVTTLGGLLIVLGSFLPWLTATAPLIGTITVNGLQGGGDGIITLVASQKRCKRLGAQAPG
jgi:hypothetical protein